MDRKKYSTAEICKIFNITRKKLRYLEELGVLKDVLRGDENNYRYYTESHINEIVLVRELQNIGFSLNEITAMSLESSLNGIHESVKKRMLNAKEDLKQSMVLYDKSVEKYIQVEAAISLLKESKEMDHKHKNEISKYEIIDFNSQYVVSVSFEGSFMDIEKAYFKNLAKIYQIIEEYNIITIGSVIIVYHNHYDSDHCAFNHAHRLVEVCLPIMNIHTLCPYCKKLEGFRGVATKFFGSFDDGLLKTYIDLMIWAKQEGYKLANTSYEDNLIGPFLTRNEEYWVTNIMIPILDE